MTDTPKLLTEEDVDADIWFGGQKEKVFALVRHIALLTKELEELKESEKSKTR